ncbi:MAG: proline-rich domain-containing protein [Patescibacteria group bacterium]
MKNFKKFLPILIIVLGMVVSISVLAQTGEDELEVKVSIKVTYPVAELGNCGSKAECKAFCDNPANINACVAFAKNKGLMNESEARRAEKFSQSLQSGKTPGNCATPEECKSYCEDVSRIEECLAFAEENDLADPDLQEGKKIRDYLKTGGKMPGGCTSKNSCETYCEDFAHIEECMSFSEKAGLGTGGPQGPDGERRGPPPKQMLELIKSGQTPGGCKSRNECEAYCGGGNHFEECIAFAEKAGFMDPKEAELVKKTGGKGPGGCQGKQACDAFCNDPANRDTCFKFAEDNGLISPEDLKMAKEGMTRMRAGLESAPPEVKDCLKSELGPNIIEDIQSGKLVPGPEIGDKARSCFEKAGGGMNPGEVLKNAPPEVLSCLKEKNIDVEKIKSGKTEFTPETGDAFRVCFESMKFIGPNGPMMSGGGGPNGGQGGPVGGPQPNFGEFLRSAPQEVLGCLGGALGGDFEKIKSGEAQPTSDMGEKMRKCFEQFRPQGPMMRSGGEGGNFGPSDSNNSGGGNGPRTMGLEGNRGGTSGPNFPEAVSNCLKGRLSEDQIKGLMNGSRPSGDIEQAIGKCFSENGGMGNFASPQGQGFQPPTQGTSPSGQMGPNNQLPPNGMMPPEGGQFPGGTPPNGFTGNQPPTGMMPPAGQMPPAGFIPPQGFTPPPDGQFPSGFTPPPGEFQNGTPPPPSQSYQNKPSLLGVIFGPLLNLFSR